MREGFIPYLASYHSHSAQGSKIAVQGPTILGDIANKFYNGMVSHRRSVIGMGRLAKPRPNKLGTDCFTYTIHTLRKEAFL